MLSNMACSLIEHKRITTTVAKAKALRGYVEPLITKSKTDSTHSRRTVFSYLRNKYSVSELFREVAPKVADRPGGYTRIIRLGNRLGDNAEMCLIELVDFNELMLQDAQPAKKTTRRRGGKKKTTDSPEASSDEKVKAAKTEAPSEEKKPKASAEEKAPKKYEKTGSDDSSSAQASADEEKKNEE